MAAFPNSGGNEVDQYSLSFDKWTYCLNDSNPISSESRIRTTWKRCVFSGSRPCKHNALLIWRVDKDEDGATRDETLNKADGPPVQDINTKGNPVFTHLQSSPEDMTRTA